jgi:diaminopimelate epimerase
MLFHKFQALGNDFLIVREAELRAETDDSGAFARRICDRHFGAGADGVEVLLGEPQTAEADFEIRLFNADGGGTPISGNGTRCVAAYLYLIEGWAAPSVTIATGAGLKQLRLVESDGGRFVFAMEMGTPRLRSEEIPVALPTPVERVIRQPLEVDGRAIEFTSVSMGNPHCSLFVEDFEGLDWRSLGALLEHHAAFPERTNVEFIRVINRHEIDVRFWERGVGETLASGTGACGAALAAMLNALTERRVTVSTAAGALIVEWRADGTVVQTGEARAVYQGAWVEESEVRSAKSEVGSPKSEGVRGSQFGTSNSESRTQCLGERTSASALSYVPLAYFSNAAEAGMVCEMLLNNGFRALLSGANFGALEPLPLPGGYSEIKLLVAKPDFMRAQQFYQAFFERHLPCEETEEGGDE